MKTAISIPNDLYAEAELMAKNRGTSRSRLYADAIREARHEPGGITEALNRVCDEIDARIDPAVSAASHRILQQIEW